MNDINLSYCGPMTALQNQFSTRCNVMGNTPIGIAPMSGGDFETK